MTKRWVSEKKRDYYYRKAKQEKYRSRAAYKLIQINERFNVIHPGDRVIDLGASPGGWSQVALELVEHGKVVAVDIKRMRPIESVEFVQGDVRERGTVQKIIEALGGPADVVISDMAPNISGNYSTDHARSIELCEHALSVAREALREGGSMILKVFEGDMYPNLMKKMKSHFRMVKGHGPKASRSASSEIYLIAMNFIGSAPPEIV